MVAEAGGGAGGELPGLEDGAGFKKVADLIGRAVVSRAEGEVGNEGSGEWRVES